jgi:GT2 family glycosyltransferase
MRKNHQRRVFLPGWLLLFLGVVRRRPDRAAAIAYWYLTRRRMRAGYRLREAAADLPEVYRIWIGSIEHREYQDLRAVFRTEPSTPRFSIVIYAPAWASQAMLRDTFESIRAQISGQYQIIVIGPEHLSEQVGEGVVVVTSHPADLLSDWQSALQTAVGDFVLIVPPNAILPCWALARYSTGVRQHPRASILFGDEDLINETGGRSQPWFKPQWNAELILAQDYISHACIIATPRARAAVETVGDIIDNPGYALMLAVSAQADVEVCHLAHVLCHMRMEARPQNPVANQRVVARHVAPMHATVELGPFGSTRVHWPLPKSPPSVTIIIPTRDRIDLLEACVGSLLRNTDYIPYDVLVVDNASVEPQTQAWFEAMASHERVSILAYDRPYNYSAINNFAAQHAQGEYLCLLNNDTEIISKPWLSELMRYAVRSEVGAVGAKLLYPDYSIQHAGVTIGLGNAAGHAHRALPNDASGYFGFAHAAHYVSAVTAACLVVQASKFAAVGGLDETDLQIAYNDVDLCLKLAREGWRNVYAPQSVMIHHESKSRGLDLSPQHVERYHRELAVFQRRWSTKTAVDPMHHPRLDRASETYRIAL